MKRFRVMAAALCAGVLLCGFSVPAYAYADGGEGADYGDPTMTEESPAPEPTIEPGEGFSEEGSLVTRDLLYDEHTNKQFITVQTSGGNTFYIVIDYDIVIGIHSVGLLRGTAETFFDHFRALSSAAGKTFFQVLRSRRYDKYEKRVWEFLLDIECSLDLDL